MSEINQVLILLEDHRQSQLRLFDKIDDIRERTIRIETNHSTMVKDLEGLDEAVKDGDERISVLERGKNRLLGIATGLGLGGAGIGTTISDWFKS